MNLETYLYESLHKFDIVLTVTGNVGVQITINGAEKYKGSLYQGTHILTYNEHLQKHDPGSVCVSMFGKNTKHTVVRDGKIVKDTTVTVEDISINGISLSKIGEIHMGVYTPEYWHDYTGDKPVHITGARTMGFNGVWSYVWEESPMRHIINQKDTIEQTSINQNMDHIFKELKLT